MYLHRQNKLGEYNFRSEDIDIVDSNAVLFERGAPFQTCWAQGNL